MQGELFNAGLRQRHQALDHAIDAIRGRFSAGAIRRGSRVDGERRQAGGPEPG